MFSIFKNRKKLLDAEEKGAKWMQTMTSDIEEKTTAYISKVYILIGQDVAWSEAEKSGNLHTVLTHYIGACDGIDDALNKIYGDYSEFIEKINMPTVTVWFKSHKANTAIICKDILFRKLNVAITKRI
jgi:hypothetical protein